ncbi:hypothetical protein BCUE_0134 [Candidatus Kinetoplastibacterium blastocrithidii TCC012E]|uniref:DUF502 domain-containing protein n=1 Tax=Candidatus Kinetoplastidibacterium blastocrithidiae TCC012E TaxID=1208922 RepID=M1M1G8_9PROT|nr:DUF502 domain-containing protein [Candidatus Kinetoplastibacterium blastocrithidii]AFZ83300.1 membrane protein [Candidatus Kinetoplastibacterium blastocrithidii (ex Strigomonas culicis)]AGF50116.1 hypothetical protein BCUE_0134 [Candidatus Kinetoplastibacterium blastocrithidii TCC012E]
MFKKYFITGLLVWVPIIITLWVLGLLVSILEASVPECLSSKSLFGHYIPGFQLVLVVVVIWTSGVLTANLIGRTLLGYWNTILGKIPLVRSIYNSVKQVSDTVLSTDSQSFRQAVLIEYPRNECWTVAFITGSPGNNIISCLPYDNYVSVYVPTAPNPTSGFFLIVRKDSIKSLDMNVDTALKYIVSMGVVSTYKIK